MQCRTRDYVHIEHRLFVCGPPFLLAEFSAFDQSVARMQSAHGNPIVTAFQCRSLRQSPHTELGRRVWRRPFAAALCRDAADIDDASPSGGLHDAKGLPDT